MLNRRRILPIGVTRGSRDDLNTGPSISFSALSSKRVCSAVSTMDRSLYMTNRRPFRPHRSCSKSTGPGDVSLTIAALTPITRRAGTPKINVSARSMTRRTNSKASFVGVVLNERRGNPSNWCSSIRAIECGKKLRTTLAVTPSSSHKRKVSLNSSNVSLFATTMSSSMPPESSKARTSFCHYT